MRLWHHFFCLTEESCEGSFLFDSCIMLTCLENNDQVGEIVSFFCRCENLRVVVIKVHIAELFEDIENDLRVNTSHSECL